MAEKNDKTGAMQVDIDLVRQLAAVLDDTNLTEIEVEDGDRKVRVARTVQAAPALLQAPMAAPVAAPAAAAPVAAAVEAAPVAALNAVKSPMVGTVYLAPNPEAANFVSVGQTVKAGDTLLIIEAMKVMNPIHATSAGTVKAILVDNGQPVEFDQPLVVVE
ncbi:MULTISPECIES: acetyl-CoA carboxylase biotin carboxyl carrier protein [Sphingomonas]|uniref:Biotin carboxyl carrier protein of acetyl-CoA carboxylase n=1 Tax=Sphingomonas leidyi TaxID=68569 RepID=A0A7X5ZTZ1_9SPHN|nr:MULTISPECIES: acetyl-CoA carboxylase biotin carboxyl carrier protein [Sphingomonas]MBN8811886.1 acetyl-CoA carboxylase biotin carboxyl carrier protein [Sphingomonas sp.]NIJ63480.1 acetyl-CoA carboxylase biotin carboxyl carrier protein [Sphingomonas leidyi]OJY48454.1 MAG: acetyl-CoA carboxylase, biotin carboxyl carrier protein [Sphingomonas sp. 67-41]